MTMKSTTSRKLCNEIFGEENFSRGIDLAEGVICHSQDSGRTSEHHDYVLVYARNAGSRDRPCYHRSAG